MTITQILLELAPHKEMSLRTLYSHVSALKIKPVGQVSQRPQQYPDDTPQRILKRLGKTPKKVGAR
ncbi:MAG TPA: hypothetical protein VK846_16260 [Candidatus Limnocylindria bacterium]|nr:hypothetical protein [Candidatus Limnocylindria bacterium]